MEQATDRVSIVSGMLADANKRIEELEKEVQALKNIIKLAKKALNGK
jgi:transcription antitermination factor NusG